MGSWLRAAAGNGSRQRGSWSPQQQEAAAAVQPRTPPGRIGQLCTSVTCSRRLGPPLLPAPTLSVLRSTCTPGSVTTCPFTLTYGSGGRGSCRTRRAQSLGRQAGDWGQSPAEHPLHAKAPNWPSACRKAPHSTPQAVRTATLPAAYSPVVPPPAHVPRSPAQQRLAHLPPAVRPALLMPAPAAA